MKQIITLFLIASICGKAQNSPYSIGIDLTIIDKTVDPKKDLMRFAAGKWLDQSTIPPSESSWGSFSQIRERNEINLKELLIEISKNNTYKPGSDEKKLHDFYLAAMDSVQLNKNGLSPLKLQLNLIDSIKTKNQIFKAIAQMHRSGAYSAFDIGVGGDLKDSKMNRLYFSQGGMGLASPAFYADANYQSIRDEYKKHIGRTFELMKYTAAAAKLSAEDAFSFEQKLAAASMSLVELRDVENQYNKMSKSDFKKLSPSFPIDLYMQAIGSSCPDTLIISQPIFFKNISKMLDSVSFSVWKNYLKWYLVHQMLPYLSDDCVKENFSFYGTVLSGTKQMKPRWKRVTNSTDRALGDALGKMFVAKFFNLDAKKRVNIMVDNLIAAFKERIKTRVWMSESTKIAAISKLDKVYRKLGYPDKWEDYSKLRINQKSYVNNYMESNKWQMAKNLADMYKPVDKTKWGMTPPTVNAYYNPSTNEICFPAGIMQPPFFDPAADDAFNYGIMGAVIGHELSHGFDDQGSQFDGDGNFVTWWAKEDVDKFKKMTEGLVNQFDNYVAIDTFHVNGKLTLGENIADLGGLTMAYYAYKKSLNGKASDTKEGYTGEQRFFLSWAQGWKIKMRDASLKQLVATNPHSPGYFRAIGTPSNMQEFYDAFQVKEGDKMYRPKSLRVEIW